MATGVRRSSGTNMYLDRLLFRKPRPDLDIEAYRAGTTIKVQSMLRRFEDISSPFSSAGGVARITLGQPFQWRGRGGPVQLTGPFELNEVGGRILMGRNFTRCMLSAAQGDYEFIVPTLDLALLRLALNSGAEQPATSPQSPVTEADPD